MTNKLSKFRNKNRGKTRTTKRVKNNKSQKLFKKLNCSPKNKHNEYTCYSDDDLIKLKGMWNARHPDKPITKNDSKQIWQQLKDYYASICNKESCWVRQMTKNTKMEKELLEAFAPESPKEWEKNPNEWLSSLDILQVMNQYEKKYKCFDFLGPSPIDYDTHKLYGECVWDELCHFNLDNQIKKGFTKFGVIFNLDPHYKGGSHWVSLFINIKKHTIFYFDSTGEAIPAQIKKFVDDVIKQGRELKKPINFIFDENHPVEHQYGNTECGIYSIFFVIHMLEDKITGHYMKTHILKDKYIEQFRNIFYNNNGDV
jgi:hypothetical protein